MALDLSGIGTLIPVFGFLLVFTVVFALLAKTKALGEQRWVHVFVSFVVAIITVASANAIEYVKTITPWFAAFVVSILFISLLVGVLRQDIEGFF